MVFIKSKLVVLRIFHFICFANAAVKEPIGIALGQQGGT